MGNCAGVNRSGEDDIKPEVIDDPMRTDGAKDQEGQLFREAQASADLVETNDKADDNWISRSLRQNTFFVAAGLTEEELFNRRGMKQLFNSAEDYRSMVQNHSRAASVRVQTPDGRSLDAGWIEAEGQLRCGRSAVILFHANAATWLDMVMWAEYYYRRGFSALCVTMGGYPGSEGDTSEMSTYLDAAGAVRYCIDKGISESCIIAHGVSIGGALASAAGVMFPGLNVTMDQSFSSGNAVARSTASKIRALPVPQWVVDQGMSMAFTTGLRDSRCPNVTTDMYDNMSKAASIEGHYFALYAERDHMMPPSFATDLVRAHYHAVATKSQNAAHVGSLAVRVLKKRLAKLGIDWKAAHCTEKSELSDLLLAKAKDVKLKNICSRNTSKIKGAQHGQFFGDDGDATDAYASYLLRIGFQ